jgi:hypothetical protein
VAESAKSWTEYKEFVMASHEFKELKKPVKKSHLSHSVERIDQRKKKRRESKIDTAMVEAALAQE